MIQVLKNKIIISAEEKNLSDIRKILFVLFPDFEPVLIPGDNFLVFDEKKISFGLNKNADFYASDINETGDKITFKLNYKGNSVPIWIPQEYKMENILCVICVGDALGLNIIEISERLKKL